MKNVFYVLIFVLALLARAKAAAAPDPPGPLATITVSVSLEVQTGTVVVNVNPDTASWSFTDGIGGVHTGTGDQTVSNVPTGPITLAWNTLRWYDPPASPSPQNLAKDGTIMFTGVYTRRTGTVQVEATPDAAPWSFKDGDGATRNGTGDATVASVPTGTITLTWGALADYDAPDPNPETKELFKNEIVTFTGNYTHKANVEDWMLYE
jgi:hypothetical protein